MSQSKSIVTLPSDTEVHIVREFDADVNLVYRANTEDALIVRWMATPGWNLELKEHDLRPGGHYYMEWTSTGDQGSFAFEGDFKEIVPNEKLVMVERFVGAPGHCLVTTTFEDLGGRTRLTMNMNYDSPESRDMAVKTGMTDGLEVCFQTLEGIVTTEAI